MTSLRFAAPAGALAPQATALAGLGGALEAAIDAAERWTSEALAAADEDTRPLIWASASRGLDRAAQLRALLGRRPASPAGVTLSAALEHSTQLMLRRHPELGTACDPRPSASVPLAERARLAIAAALTTALSNTARHSIHPHVEIGVCRAATHRSVWVREGPAAALFIPSGPPVPVTVGAGLELAATLATSAGGSLSAEWNGDAVIVGVRLPLSSFLEHGREAPAPTLSARADAALRCLDVHGLATPFLESRWLHRSARTSALTGALDDLASAAEVLAGTPPGE